MNKNRKSEIRILINEINCNKGKLELILNDEQDYFDNMPENLQGSIRGMISEDAISSLEDAMEYLNNAIESLEEV